MRDHSSDSRRPNGRRIVPAGSAEALGRTEATHGGEGSDEAAFTSNNWHGEYDADRLPERVEPLSTKARHLKRALSRLDGVPFVEVDEP